MKHHNYVCILVLCIFTVAVLAACGNKDRGTTQESMSVNLGKDGMIRNGTEYFTYQVPEDRKGIVSVSVLKEAGRLDMDIYPVNSKDNPDYTGRDMDTASFEVVLKTPGEYKICITAKNYVGDYAINWHTEENSE